MENPTKRNRFLFCNPFISPSCILRYGVSGAQVKNLGMVIQPIKNKRGSYEQ